MGMIQSSLTRRKIVGGRVSGALRSVAMVEIQSSLTRRGWVLLTLIPALKRRAKLIPTLCVEARG